MSPLGRGQFLQHGNESRIALPDEAVLDRRIVPIRIRSHKRKGDGNCRGDGKRKLILPEAGAGDFARNRGNIQASLVQPGHSQRQAN
jgi:hypothetical protein